MMKFFRKIRQKILTDNKIKRYLIYAMGKIVLVVIGISVALQVNNWNTEQKVEIEETSILNNLLESLYSAKEQSDAEINKENQLKESQLIALGKNDTKSKQYYRYYF